MGVNCWPTVMIFGPDNRPIFQATGEGNEHTLEKMLLACIEKYLKMEEEGDTNWVLDPTELPLQSEKDKHQSVKTTFTLPE